MKWIILAIVYSCLSCATLLLACREKPDTKTELDKAAATLGAAEPVSVPAAAPAEPSTSAQTETAASPQLAALPAGTPAQQMQLAISAYKAGELEDAVTRLQKLRSMPTLTAQQRMALQDSVAAVMTEVYSLAAKGDSRAIQAVRQYEEMQTSRH